MASCAWAPPKVPLFTAHEHHNDTEQQHRKAITVQLYPHSRPAWPVLPNVTPTCEQGIKTVFILVAIMAYSLLLTFCPCASKLAEEKAWLQYQLCHFRCISVSLLSWQYVLDLLTDLFVQSLVCTWGNPSRLTTALKGDYQIWGPCLEWYACHSAGKKNKTFAFTQFCTVITWHYVQ